MRRTLAVLVTTAALLVPATAASASHGTVHLNASCNSGEQRGPNHGYNAKGKSGNTAGCESPAVDAGSGGSGDGDPFDAS